jgi:hypothetical protein
MRALITPVPPILVVIIFSLFVPEGLSFYLAGLRLTVTRLTFLIITPILLQQLSRLVSTGRYRFVFSDLFAPMTGVWMFLAVSVSQGADMALAHAGPEVLEICIGYLATRVLLAKHGQALSFASLLCCTIAVVALLGLLDPLTGHPLIHDWTDKLTGYKEGWLEGAQVLYRHGFLRAYGPLEQPLLFGLVCCIGFILALSGRVRARPAVLIACCLGLFFAGESAPVLGAILGVALLLYDRILAGVSVKWLGLIAAAAAGIGAIYVVSDNPSTVIVRYLTLDPQSGYFRLWTWTLATDLLRHSPWVGLGFLQFSGESYELPSIDNMWLAFALVYGYPGSILLGLSMLGAMSLPTSGRRVNLTAAESKLGTMLSITLFAIALIAYTVHIWGPVRILMGLLIGLRAHLGALGRLPYRAQPEPPVFDLPELSAATTVSSV